MTFGHAIALAGLLLAAAVSGFASARAAPGDRVLATYEISIDGMAAVSVAYDAEISGTGYRSRASLETKGVLSLFSSYRMDMTAFGVIAKGKLRSGQFSSVAGNRNKKKFFAVNLPVANLQDQPSDQDPLTRAEINAAITAGTIDPLTSVIRLGGWPIDNPCQATQRVFDGQEVFDLHFDFEKDDVITSHFEGVYRGPAFECRMTYVPVAGVSATKFRKSKASPPVFTVWIAPVHSFARDASVLIPVFATGVFDGQKFIAYATQATIAGHPLNQASRSKD